MERKTEILLFRWLRPHHFVLLMGTSAFLAFVCGYAISVGTDKVGALFPYISDTGTEPPASCVFGLLLNIAAVSGIISIYIRHSHFESNSSENDRIHSINDIALFIGFLSCLGMMIVASFQWTKVLVPHLIGAFMVFILGNVYCWLQSYLTYVSIGEMNTKRRFIVRIMLSMCSALFFVFTFLFGSISRNKARGTKVNSLHWNSKNPGYSAHLASTFSEWIMAICFLLFFLTFYHEFKTLDSRVRISNAMTEDLVVTEQQSASC